MPPKRASLRDRTDIGASAPPPPAASAEPPQESALWGAERGEQTVVELALREIMPNRRQPRANPAEAQLDELAESIRTHGVIQPVIVRVIPLTKYDGAGRRYELIAGERRWRAAALAGRETIPALIRVEQADQRAMLELALIENVQRQDLHPLDEAAALSQLHDELGLSYNEIAARIGKSKAYVTNRMRLMQLDEDLRALVATRPDTIKHVYELARIADPALRASLVQAVRDEDLSRAVTSTRVDAVLGIDNSRRSVSQETERDNFHEASALGASQSVSQETERDTFHEASALGARQSVSQETERDAFHEVSALDARQSVSQETERDAFHEASALDARQSVSQETERYEIHNHANSGMTLPGQREGGDAASHETRLARDLYALGRMLDRWELQAARDDGEARTALLRIVDELSTRLERIARGLLDDEATSSPR